MGGGAEKKGEKERETLSLRCCSRTICFKTHSVITIHKPMAVPGNQSKTLRCNLFDLRYSFVFPNLSLKFLRFIELFAASQNNTHEANPAKFICSGFQLYV